MSFTGWNYKRDHKNVFQVSPIIGMHLMLSFGSFPFSKSSNMQHFFLQLQWLAWAQNNKNISHRCKWRSLLAVNKHCHARTLYPWRQESTWIPFRCHGYSQGGPYYPNLQKCCDVTGLRSSWTVACSQLTTVIGQKKRGTLASSYSNFMKCSRCLAPWATYRALIFKKPYCCSCPRGNEFRGRHTASDMAQLMQVLRHLAITPSSDQRTAEPRFGNQSQFFLPPKVSPSPLLTVAICS